METELTITHESLLLGTFEFDLTTTTKHIAPNGKVAIRKSNYEVSLSIIEFAGNAGVILRSTDEKEFEKQFNSIEDFEDWASNITDYESQKTWKDMQTGIKKTQWFKHSRELAWAGFKSWEQHQDERDAHHQPEYQTCQ